MFPGVIWYPFASTSEALEGSASAMALYRDVAINGMVGTIEDAMRQVLDCWAELPPEMQEAIEQFRVQLGAAIDSVYLVKRALDQEVHESEMRLS
ncbi:MAG TPA: hypothetical protein VLC74_08095 [Rhizomicrobium sp.]|nr:hypothetical protein [Rhizomicrobium sp.]